MMEQAIYAFCIDAAPISCAPHGGGHINHTFLAKTKEQKKYILQGINSTIFRDTDALMENMSSRLEHMIEFYNS